MNVSRRSALRLLGSSGTAMAVGLFPELGLRGGGGEEDDDGFEPLTRNLLTRPLRVTEIASESARARSDDEAGVLWRDLTSRGLEPDLGVAYGTRARLREDRTLAGQFLAVPFADGRDRRAKLYYGSDMLGKRVAFASEWKANAPEVIDLRDVKGGHATRRSTVKIAGEHVDVEFGDGRRKSADLTFLHQGRRGSASVAADGCSLNGLACTLACGTVIEWSCLYEFSVACVGVTAICPPCGGVCEIVAIVVCTVTSLVSCYYVCQPC
jgi:hypothetical protein